MRKLRDPGEGTVDINTADAEELQQLPGVRSWIPEGDSEEPRNGGIGCRISSAGRMAALRPSEQPNRRV